MRHLLFLVISLCAGYSAFCAETPLRFNPVFPADIPYASDAKHSASVMQLMEKEEALVKELLAVRTKILKDDAECKAIHEKLSAAEKNLDGHLRGRRSVVEMEHNLLQVEIRIKKLEFAKESDRNKDAVKFVSQGKSNLDSSIFKDPQKAAELFTEREEILSKMIAERKRLLASDPKAKALAAEVMKYGKELAVHMESKKEFRAVLDQLDAVNKKLQVELKKEKQAVKPANTQKSK